MSSQDTALLVIDVQGKLVGLIQNHRRLVWNIRRLLDAAKLFGVHTMATEQYPKGLGATTAELASRLGDVASKTRFSCGCCPDIFADLPMKGIRKILLVGIETHVCVQQTALDLLTAGFEVYLAVDALGTRNPVDHRIGIRRMELAGAYLTTVESAMFEWCEDSKSEQFKAMSQLIQEQPPTDE